MIKNVLCKYWFNDDLLAFLFKNVVSTFSAYTKFLDLNYFS